MKYSLIFGLILLPVVAFAGTVETLNSLDMYSDVFRNLSVWSTIIVAFVTTVMVWLGGRSLHGGILGSVLDYFSIGMTLMFAGFLINIPTIAERIPLQYPAGFVHDILFVVAYILMGLGVSKLLKIIKGE